MKETSRIYSNRYILCFFRRRILTSISIYIHIYIYTYTWCRVYKTNTRTHTRKKKKTRHYKCDEAICASFKANKFIQIRWPIKTNTWHACNPPACCLLQQKALLSFKDLTKRQSSSIMTTIHVRSIFLMCNLSVGTTIHIHKFNNNDNNAMNYYV